MRATAVAALLWLALHPATAGAEGENLEVALAAAPGQEPVCRSLTAELRSIGVDSRVLDERGEPAERPARAAGATVLVLCEAEPARIVIRFLDGSWPTDPAYVIAIDLAEVDAAVLDTSEWLRARLSAPHPRPAQAESPDEEVEEEPSPLPRWTGPYIFAGALHDPLAQPRFFRPFLAAGIGFFPVGGLHVFAQLSSQVYRIDGIASGVRYRLSADHGQIGIGHLHLIGRRYFGIVFDARFGLIRVRARGESGPGFRGQDEVAWNPLVLVGWGLFARTRGPVAFRATAAFRTQFNDVRIYLGDELVRTAEALGYALQWQMEVAL